jgi:site-specific recombinase XerD
VTRKTFKKLTTSDELWEQVNPHNKKLVSQFLKEKNIRSSEQTVRGYESDLHIFMIWNLNFNENKYFVDIKKLEFSSFFSYIVEEMHVGSARFSRLRSVLSTLSIFIEKYLDDSNPNFRNVILKSIESMPKNPVREKTILKEEQVNKLLEFFDETNPQIACWLSLLFGSGSRFSELLRFQTNLLDEKNLAFNDIFIETSKTIKTKGRGKAGKMLTKYIIKDIFWDRYQKWLEIRKEILAKRGKDHEFIFIKMNGDPAEESTARGWVEKVESFLGIPFYPHAGRHFFCTFLSRSKLPPDLIQEIIGWSSDGMVRLYNDMSIREREFTELDNLKNSLEKNKTSIL